MAQSQLVFLLFCLAVVPTCSQPCNTASSDNLMDSGIVEVQIADGSVSPFYSFLTRPLSYTPSSRAIQTAASFIFDPTSRPSTRIKYVLNTRANESGIIFTINLELDIVEWTSIRISYLASSRPDLQMGSYIPNLVIFGRPIRNTTVMDRKIPLSQFDAQGRSFVPFLFVSGIYADNGFLVSISDPLFRSAATEIVFKLQISVNLGFKVHELRISYVLVPEDFVFEANIVPSPTGSAIYSIQGVSFMNTQRITQNALQFGQNSQIQCLGSLCSGSCLAPSQCERVGGQIVQNRCLACPQNSFLNGNECVCNSGFQLNSRGECEQSRVNCQVFAEYDTASRRCVCIQGYRETSPDSCQRVSCPPNSIFSSSSGECECQQGYIENRIGNCIQVQSCPPPLVYSIRSGQCQCPDGQTRRGDRCISGCESNQIEVDGSCICRPGYVRMESGQCGECEGDSFSNREQTMCLCFEPSAIYIEEEENCVPCPANSGPNDERSACICMQGYYMEDGICKAYRRCPARSELDEFSQNCRCLVEGEHLINDLCQRCLPNEMWNGMECICEAGYYRIRGRCQTCDENSVYDGENCLCKYGFYENNGRCQPCDSSCGQCLGPSRNQCIICTDVSYTLNRGTCIRNQPCPIGTYREQNQCIACSQYCVNCTSERSCSSCVDGFSLEFFSEDVSVCIEECGDGTRFKDECDDGNLLNGDGCSNQCEVEDGWTCMGGTSMGTSNCRRGRPENSVINLVGTVTQIHTVLQSVRISYLSDCAVTQNCQNCSSLLKVRVSHSEFPIRTEVIFIPNSKWHFYITFDFGQAFANSGFTFVLELNPEFAGCFNDKDMRQQLRVTVDPTLLKLLEHPPVVNLEGLS